jgi:hypothetical protein
MSSSNNNSHTSQSSGRRVVAKEKQGKMFYREILIVYSQASSKALDYVGDDGVSELASCDFVTATRRRVMTDESSTPWNQKTFSAAHAPTYRQTVPEPHFLRRPRKPLFLAKRYGMLEFSYPSTETISYKARTRTTIAATNILEGNFLD